MTISWHVEPPENRKNAIFVPSGEYCASLPGGQQPRPLRRIEVQDVSALVVQELARVTWKRSVRRTSAPDHESYNRGQDKRDRGYLTEPHSKTPSDHRNQRDARALGEYSR